MKKIYNREELKRIRRENLRDIANNRGGNSYLVSALGKSPSQISQIMGNPGNEFAKIKGIGNALAREIEQKLDLAPGALDEEASTRDKGFQMVLGDLDKTDAPASNSLTITPQAAEHFDKNYGNSIMVMCTDDGMAPKINMQDIMICQTVDGFSGDGIYIVSQDGHRYTRHVSRRPGTQTLTIKAKDDMISDYDAPENDVILLARVMRILNERPA